MHQRRDPELAAIPVVIVSAAASREIDQNAEAVFAGQYPSESLSKQ